MSAFGRLPANRFARRPGEFAAKRGIQTEEG